MARAYATPRQDIGQQSGGEWQALRGELVELLDQVETQAARARGGDAPGLAERMQQLRQQAAPRQPEARHVEALRSVQRAVDRLSERDDYAETAGHERDTLHSAIRQIRARHGDVAVPRASRPADMGPQDSPRFGDLAEAVGGISGRLERLEAELRSASRSQSGNVKEIAEQVAQLSHVVELLAGAVGETGQVKRLEAQIAGLAQQFAQGHQVDLSGLTRRLDDVAQAVSLMVERDDRGALAQRLDHVSTTIGQLADLQVQFANRADNSAKAAGGVREGMSAIEDSIRRLAERMDTALPDGVALKDSLGSVESSIRAIADRVDMGARSSGDMRDGISDIAAGLRDGLSTIDEATRGLYDRLAVTAKAESNLLAGMSKIEQDIRAIYDRMDTIERNEAMPAADMDALAGQMAELTAALRNPANPEGIVALLEQINARVLTINDTTHQVGGLKDDVQALSTAVIDAIEPRFAALEMRLASLSDQVVAPATESPNLDALEAQVRQLIERMDQTGAQLTGLAELYNQPAEVPAPDYRALADFVATRTSEAMAQSRPADAVGIAPTDFDEIERRVARLMEAASAERPADDISGIMASIREVNDRLARLETSLAADADGAPRAEAPAAATPRYELAESYRPLVARLHNDAMPADPSVEAPLRDRGFGEPAGDPVRSALEVKNGTRPRPTVSAADLPPPSAYPEPEVRPHFDPAAVERPPRPISSFDSPDAEVFTAPPAAAEPVAPEASPAAASTNTFIAAARRAAQRKPEADRPVASGSLIARAFANLQPNKDAEPAATGDKPAKGKPVKQKPVKQKPVKGAKAKAALKLETPLDEVAAPEVVVAPKPEPAEATRDSFLSRNRRPILLAASIVALAFLTLNLVSQRLNGEPAATRAASASGDTAQTSDIAPVALSSKPTAVADADPLSGPRVIPIVDSLATASIDPKTVAAFSTDAAATMPNAFVSTAPIDEAKAPLPGLQLPALEAPAAMASPVEVEMPPENVGPEPLRAAASHGDARAQFEIAAIYTEGRAVPEDLAAAAVWYERSAAQGFAPAQYRLANLYENGRGIDKDLQQARLWYQRAAEAGNRMAMHNLAALYAGGELGKQDFDSAAQWFEQAAARGMRDSQFNLGMLYARGLGVPQSFEDSYKWFSLAANRGDADAAKARDDVARSLDADAMSRVNDELAKFAPAPIDLVANFAPIGTWSDRFDPGETITTRDVVKSVQAALAFLGYSVGTPDGLAGPKTAEAIRAFERSTGMSESGAVNPRLLAVLGSQPV